MPKIILYNQSKKVFFTIFQTLSIVLFVSLFSFINQTLNSDNINEDLELIFVYEHVRHGIRGPSASYNSLFINGVDEFRVSWEGEGDGELTLLGRRQHYDLGVRNRIKYRKGENGLGLIDFSKYNPEEVLFHVSDYNRTHQSLNSQLLGMYQPGILKSLNPQEINGSFPPNAEKWFNEKSESIYSEILEEINSLDNQTIIDNIPIFNVHPFGENRIFNLEKNCKSLDNMRIESLKGKEDLLYGYFLKYKEELKTFFNFEDYSNFTNVRIMNSITDHYIGDYKSFKDLSLFHNITAIDLDEFYEESTKFYYNWLYNYYCTNKTCVMESSRLMEDLLGYMERRIHFYPKTTYYAPKLVIDCGHDTTVGPMQMFMYEAWKDKPEYDVKTKYCGFASNIYFELYKKREDKPKYYVYYYIDEELIHIFEYDEFKETIRNHIYTQDEIAEYCKNDKEECKDDKSFSDSFKNHKGLWISLFIFIFTTILGIIGIIFLLLKIRHSQKLSSNINTKENLQLMESLE